MTSPPEPERRHPGDGPDAGDPTPLTAAEEREVAALLAEAVGRGAVTPPPDVVARLDDVLADLVAERGVTRTPREPVPETVPEAVPETDGTVVRLEARRRRLPQVLLAAAAVVVGGYAVGNLAFDGSLTGDGLQAGSADSAAGGDSAEDSAGGSTAAGSGTDNRELTGGSTMTLLPTVRRDHVAADVRRVVRLFDGAGVTGRPAEATPVPRVKGDSGGDGSVEETSPCPVPRLTDGQQLYQVRYRGAPAGLVVGAAHQGTVDITIYSCRTGGVQLSGAVPAP